MRRIALTLALAVGLPVLLALGLGAGNGGVGSGYTVRAIFDNAANVVSGEDVKVAGAKVGKVKSLDVTPQNKAAVVLEVDKAGFSPFHSDASCTIRPQSLIGEKYVECTPGSARAPALAKVPKGQRGSGQHLLAVQRTSSPVDIDEIADINRLPVRQRFSILVNEFGTALAGRGNDLNTVIHRANPALRDTDRVLNTLASQNKVLANLAGESDAVLAPLAARRQRVADFVVQANRTAEATAEQSANIQRTFQRFPAFLRQLKPTLTDLGDVSQEMTPVLTDLNRAAPDLNRFVVELGPFSRAATPAVKSLGHATAVGRPALVKSLPLVTLLARFASDANPLTRTLDEVTQSLDRTGAIDRAMDYIFFQVTAINGFDGVSHYLRASLLTNLCSSYAIEPVQGCNANFHQTKAIPASAAGSAGSSLAKLENALRRAKGSSGGGSGGAAGAAVPQPDPLQGLQELTDPKVAAQRDSMIQRIRRGAQHPPRQPQPSAGGGGGQQAALDYLLGGGG